MQMIFKQRFFSWFDSYDIYSPQGEVLYTVKGQLAWGHCLKIYDYAGREIGTVKEQVLTLLPRFNIYQDQQCLGSIQKELTFFRPKFHIDFNGWDVSGDWLEWDYQIIGADGAAVAQVSKQVLNWTDTYVIDVARREDALCCLMLVLAIDAEKCSRNN